MKRKFPGVLRALLPHLVLVLAAMMLTFFIIDRFNEAMMFLNNDLTKWLLVLFVAASAALAVTTVVRDEKERAAKRSAPGEKPEGEENGRS